ncbi:MAG: type II and III secretion system protein family protein [Gemmatimonadota bacterium]
METRRPGRGVIVIALSFLALVPVALQAQAAPDSAAMAAPLRVTQNTGRERLITIAVGNSALVTVPSGLRRVSIADPETADAVLVSNNEVVVNGKVGGTTSLLIWDNAGTLTIYTVRVTVDAATLEAEFQRLFPDERINVSAVGSSVVLTGEVRDARTRDKAVALAQTLGEDVTVLDHLGTPDQGQVLLHVRFAEVSRNALEQYGINVTRVDPRNLRGDDEGALTSGGVVPFTRDFIDGDGPEQTFSDAVNFFLFHDASNFGAFVQALRGQGLFRSLAEPNLLAMPGEEASFLAGGEFPVPVAQGAGANTVVTIVFKEFGIRLKFTPDITNSGAVRLHVAPEVSSLDFANGIELSGFRVPSLTSRKAETTVELMPGQTFAIAGLMDNTVVENGSKIPLLGDIPVLGALFRSKDLRQNRTELLVLVTPELVRPSDRAIDVPTGEPSTWESRLPPRENGNGR